MDIQNIITVIKSIDWKSLMYFQDDRETPIQNTDPEIKRLRELEAIKIRDRIYELNRHIAVIKRM